MCQTLKNLTHLLLHTLQWCLEVRGSLEIPLRLVVPYTQGHHYPLHPQAWEGWDPDPPFHHDNLKHQTQRLMCMLYPVKIIRSKHVNLTWISIWAREARISTRTWNGNRAFFSTFTCRPRATLWSYHITERQAVTFIVLPLIGITWEQTFGSWRAFGTFWSWLWCTNKSLKTRRTLIPWRTRNTVTTLPTQAWTDRIIIIVTNM